MDNEEEKRKSLEKFINKVSQIPLTRQYNSVNDLEKEFFISFSQYGYARKTLSKYCGIWVTEIREVLHENNYFEAKSDEWIFYGRDDYVYGTIRRLKPKQNDRIWSFVGMEFGDQLVISFTEDDRTRKSAGVMIVRRAIDFDDKMTGFYYEFSKADSKGNPIPIPITIIRKKISRQKRT